MLLKKHYLKSLVLFVLFIFSVTTQAQVRDLHNNRVFYYDEFGWSLGLSLGTVFMDELVADGEFLAELEETLIPAFSLSTEYKPFTGFSIDTSVTYFQHNLEDPVVGKFGSIKNIMPLIGGNFYHDNSSIVTPYLSTDFGMVLSFSNAEMSFLLDDNHSELIIGFDNNSLAPAAQAGTGISIDLGSVYLNLNYNYVFLGSFDLDTEFKISDELLDSVTLLVNNRIGHRIGLEVGLAPDMFGN